jgi:hypothetical protein
MAGNRSDFNWYPDPPFPATGPEKPYWWYVDKPGAGVPQSWRNAIEAAKPLWEQYRFQEANNMVETAKRALSPNINWGTPLQDRPAPVTVVNNSFSTMQANVNALIPKVNSTAAAARAMVKFSYTGDRNGKRDISIKYKIDLAFRANLDAYDLYSREINKQLALITANPASGVPTSGVSNKAKQDSVDIGLYGTYIYYSISNTPNSGFPPLPAASPPPPPPPPPVTIPPDLENFPVVDKAAADSRTKQLADDAALANSKATVSAPSATINTPAKPVSKPFVSTATFKAGTDKAANAKGAKALADAAKKAAAAAKLTPKQSKQLMDNVANAIKGNTTSGNKALAKPKVPPKGSSKPLSRPRGSNTGPVTGGGFPLPNGGAGQLPPGAVSRSSPGCFKDASGNTFCV